MYLAKDFIETSEGLVFAVIENGIEEGRVLSFLRYVDDGHNRWRKVNTGQANQLLQYHHPDYLFYAKTRDAALHGVAIERIKNHHCAQCRLQELVAMNSVDSVHLNFKKLLNLFQQQGIDTALVGVTGSLLIGAQNQQSDIDLVVYDRQIFKQIRAVTRQLIDDAYIEKLTLDDWQQSYNRRCCTISLDDYIWHERRKFNKALINGCKFDLSLVVASSKELATYTKRGRVSLKAVVIDDERGFDYPAIYKIEHPEITEVVCYTATYVGQAFIGEMIEAAGLLEQSEQGLQRLIVGNTREAEGEYIKVLVAA